MYPVTNLAAPNWPAPLGQALLLGLGLAPPGRGKVLLPGLEQALLSGISKTPGRPAVNQVQ